MKQVGRSVLGLRSFGGAGSLSRVRVESLNGCRLVLGAEPAIAFFGNDKYIPATHIVFQES